MYILIQIELMLERDIIELSQQWSQFNQCILQKFFNLEMFDNTSLQNYQEKSILVNKFMYVSIHNLKVKDIDTRLKL